LKLQEDKNHYCYEWYWVDTGTPCYVGEGSGDRAYTKHSGQGEMNQYKSDGLIAVRILQDGLTKGQGETFETNTIKKYLSEGIVLYNRNVGKSSTFVDIMSDNKLTDAEKIRKLTDTMVLYSAEKRPTPVSIIDELVNGILNTPNFSPVNKSWMNPVSRYGEFYIPLAEKIGYQNIKNNMTMIDSAESHSVFIGSGRKGESKMQEIKCIEADFNEWNTTERYDVILMNPPFKTFGEKFVLKAAGLLKDGGYLGVVMSPTWRTVGVDVGRKAYYKLLQQGGFHMIHMYSAKDTVDLFKQTIGQVDTFVWQKGVTVANTKITNQRGEEYSCDLSNYPQAPPVLPAYIYNQHFDQSDGLKWNRFTNPRNKTYGPAENIFTDITTGKEFNCNDTNIEKTKGKKVVVDQHLKNYWVDNTGDMVVNDSFMFFFDTDEERDTIVKSLQYIISNNLADLFVVVSSFQLASIPGIKR